MKKVNILLFVVILCGFALPTFAQKKVDIFGYYTIVSATNDFNDISEIHLAGDYGEQQAPPVYGLIRLRKSSTDFDLLKPTLTGKRLTFKTQAVGGVSYQFSGLFSKLGDFPTTRPEGQTVLKGTLIKMRGKRKIAQGIFNFIYSAGD